MSTNTDVKNSTEPVQSVTVVTNGNDVSKNNSTTPDLVKTKTPEKTVNCYW